MRYIKVSLVLSAVIVFFISCSSKEERQLKKTISVVFSQNNISTKGLEISPVDSAYVNPFEKEDFIALCKEYRETEKKYSEYRESLIGLENEIQRLEDRVTRQKNSISKMNSQMENEELKSTIHALSWVFGFSGKTFIANAFDMINDYATQNKLSERINSTRERMEQTKLQIDSCKYAVDALAAVYQASKVKKFATKNEILQKADDYKKQYFGKSVIVSYRKDLFSHKYYVVLSEDLAKVIQLTDISEFNETEDAARTTYSYLENAEEVLTEAYDWEQYGGGLSDDEQKSIYKFIKAVKSGDRDFVASSIDYPFARMYPLPSIDNKDLFLKHYDEYFTPDIILSITEKPWCRLGWRGIMCDNGVMWGDIGEDGVFRVNRFFMPTKEELAEREIIIKEQKAKLHPSVADFTESYLILETSKFRIRIDGTNNGMRYAAWRKPDDFSQKPSLVINDGDYWEEGTMRNPYYRFENSGYEYLISISDEDGYDYHLEVSKDKKTLLSEEAKLIQ